MMLLTLAGFLRPKNVTVTSTGAEVVLSVLAGAASRAVLTLQSAVGLFEMGYGLASRNELGLGAAQTKAKLVAASSCAVDAVRDVPVLRLRTARRDMMSVHSMRVPAAAPGAANEAHFVFRGSAAVCGKHTTRCRASLLSAGEAAVGVRTRRVAQLRTSGRAHRSAGAASCCFPCSR